MLDDKIVIVPFQQPNNFSFKNHAFSDLSLEEHPSILPIETSLNPKTMIHSHNLSTVSDPIGEKLANSPSSPQNFRSRSKSKSKSASSLNPPSYVSIKSVASHKKNFRAQTNASKFSDWKIRKNMEGQEQFYEAETPESEMQNAQHHYIKLQKYDARIKFYEHICLVLMQYCPTFFVLGAILRSFLHSGDKFG